VEFAAEDGKIAVSRKVKKGDGPAAAGDPHHVSLVQLLHILPVGRENQLFVRPPDGDLNAVGIRKNQRPVAEGMRTDHAHAEHGGAGVKDRSAGGKKVAGAAGRGGHDDAVAGEGGDRFFVDREVEGDDVRGAAETDNGIIQNPVGGDLLCAAQNGAVGHRAHPFSAGSAAQGVKSLFQFALPDACQEAEAAEIDPENGNLRAGKLPGAEENGSVTAQGQHRIHRFGEPAQFKEGCRGQAGCGLPIGKQLDPEGPGLARQTLKNVGRVRTFRVCNDTDFFHSLILATSGRVHKHLVSRKRPGAETDLLMDVDLFDFELPERLIADRPASPRDSARLLDLTGAGVADRGVLDLPALLQPGDLLIGNNTKVIPARLDGLRGEVRIEVMLHMRAGDDAWFAFARPGKRLKTGSRIDFAADFYAEVIEKREGGEILLRFNCGGEVLFRQLEAFGRMPLPPYIRREPDSERHALDREDYQTIFAKEEGAVAAPTAGLHFTERLFQGLKERGVAFETVTLHVGAGTFLPVKVDDTEDHKMHAEWGTLSQAVVDRIHATRMAGGRIAALGTTSLRLLESAATAPGEIHPFAGETDIFITPGYPFKIVDLLLTNFHLPRSTLFMLVSAFAGLERMHAAYEHAKQAGYRFYSYGDACLLKREAGPGYRA